MGQATSFGPDKVLVGVWTLLASPPALIWGVAFLKRPTPEAVYPFLLMLAFAALPLIFASRFRATFTQTEFLYRRWGSTVRVPYDDICRIEVANATPVTGQPIGVFIITRSGDRLPFWPKLFPREAVRRFFALTL